MNYYLILSAFALIFLTKDILPKLKLIIILSLSFFLLGTYLFASPEDTAIYLKLPIELLLFSGIALFEIINGKGKNAAFIIFLSFNYLLKTEEYLYLGQTLIYIISTIYHQEERFWDKAIILFFLSLWPTSIVFHHFIPHSQLNSFFPIIMSYLLILRVLKVKNISNAVFLAVAIAQIPFLKLVGNLDIDESFITVVAIILSIFILFQKKILDLLYPFLVIIPVVLKLDYALEIISILFSLKLFNKKTVLKDIISSELTKVDILKIMLLLLSVSMALLHFENIALIYLVFLIYFLNKSNSPFLFLLEKRNHILHIGSFLLIGMLGLYTVLL